VSSAAIGCTVLGGTAADIAMAVGLSSVILAPIVTCVLTSRQRMSVSGYAAVFVQGPVTAGAASAAAHGVTWLVLGDLSQFGDAKPESIGRGRALLEVVLLGGSYAVISALVVRVFMREVLMDMMRVLPGRVRRPMVGMLRLPVPDSFPAARTSSAPSSVDGEESP